MSKRCCGILYPDTEKVCVKCGEPLVDEPDEAEDAANKDTADEDENSTTVLTDEEMGVKNDPVESENAGKDDADKNTDAVTNNGSGDGADDGTDNNANDGSEDKKEAKTSDSREHSDILISGGDEKTDVLTGEPGKRKFHGKTVRDGSEYFEEEERIREVTEEEASGKKKGGSVVMKVIGIVSLVALLLFAAGLAYNYYLLFEKNPNPVYEGAAAVGFSSGVSALKDIDMSDAGETEADEETTTEEVTEATTETTEAATATDTSANTKAASEGDAN